MDSSAGGDGFSCGFAINFLGDSHVGGGGGGLTEIAGVMGVKDWKLGLLGDGGETGI